MSADTRKAPLQPDEVLPPEETAISTERVAKPPEPKLLGFYDVLRRRIKKAVSSGRLSEQTAEYLLLAPDLFFLLARLALDKQVPAASRSLIGGALAYFVLPIDLFPEGLFGVAGYLDDIVLAAGVLSHVMSPEFESLAERYWSGSERLRIVLRDIARSAEGLLGEGLYGRVRGWLDRRI